MALSKDEIDGPERCTHATVRPTAAVDPTNWEVKMSGGGKTITLDSAQPAYEANALPAEASNWTPFTWVLAPKRTLWAATSREKPFSLTACRG